jgi:hypothetical protein
MPITMNITNGISDDLLITPRDARPINTVRGTKGGKITQKKPNFVSALAIAMSLLIKVIICSKLSTICR